MGHSTINTMHPIAIPQTSDLFLFDDDFYALVQNANLLDVGESVEPHDAKVTNGDKMEDDKDLADGMSESTKISGFSDLGLESDRSEHEDPVNTGPVAVSESTQAEQDEHPFIDGLKSFTTVPEASDLEGKMLTENADLAFRSTKDPLVDLFYELEDVASDAVLRDNLQRAWAHDSLATMKIIFNARSIHLGHASRKTFYRCCGWLAETHPKTLLINLHWVVRPVIEKPDTKDPQATATSDENVEPNAKKPATNVDEAIKKKPEGMAHGYWKDLLNILALAANDELTVRVTPSKVLNIANDQSKRKRDFDPVTAKATRDKRKTDRHSNASKKFSGNTFYRLLHLSIARLFAAQLSSDKELLKGDKKEPTQLSLAAKWAPTLAGFHDQHTFVASSIAEVLYSKSSYEDKVASDRELYLKYAREDYRRLTLSPLRDALGVLERDLTAETFKNIKYERVPSLAMNMNSSLFASKDFNRFDEYLDKVARGKTSITGAVLMPSTLVYAVRTSRFQSQSKSKKSQSKMVAAKEAELQTKAVDGQWQTLCQRIRDSGTLSSSIAVCDVSLSMTSPRFKDGTCPMDSSIGLSLLLAETTQKPFGGHLITFHEHPKFIQVGGPDDKRSFAEKIKHITEADWGGSTDFVAVFEKLILPMAIKNKLKQEDMVKQVFCFSDMQFNSTNGQSSHEFSASYERIQANFERAGYEMPKLIFWNLAGGRAGYEDGSGDPTAPKPVTADEEGTALVSGYSQGQLKVLLDNGQFEDPEEEVGTTEEVDSEGEEVVRVSKKQKMDPLTIVKKAISHDAYKMLQVID